MSSTQKQVFILIIGIAAAVGTFFYFENGLWLWVNIAVSIGIGFLVSGSLACIMEGDNSLTSNNGKFAGFVMLGVTAMCFLGLHSCFHVSDAELQNRKEQAELKVQQDKVAKEEAAKKNAEEEAAFLASGKDFEIYGTVNNERWALIRAERAIKNFAKDAKSVSDVVATSKPLRIRIKAYPSCRFAMQVRFRAKNSFGAMLANDATVLFNSDWQGIAVLEGKHY